MEDKLIMLPSHQHPLFPSGKFDALCHGCGRIENYSKEGYRCSTECYRDYFLHKECAEIPETIHQHPSHLQHPLQLNHKDFWGRCSLCGEYLKGLGYECSLECEFKVCTGCGREPPALSISNPKAHPHSLSLSTTDGNDCYACGDRIFQYPYECKECSLFFHGECVHLPRDTIYLPSHHSHPLNFLNFSDPLHSMECSLCEHKPRSEHLQLYVCLLCKFGVCLGCVRNPPPLALLSPRTHDHLLTLLPRQLSFTCNACGERGDHSPYVCLPCNFLIHRDCVDLPHVINVNRHDHRLSHTYFIALKDSNLECGVCHREINCSYGAYSCSVCIDYAIHSRCATNRNVWDGKELEGVPEEDEDIQPFEKIADNLVKHFSHQEHNLILNKDGVVLEESIRCKACVRPIDSDPFYICCMHDCEFVLHETCANLPRKKRHFTSAHRFTLIPGPVVDEDIFCEACFRYITGFRYHVNENNTLDVSCASISEPLYHGSHHHPLYYEPDNEEVRCSGCGEEYPVSFICRNDGCNFGLDFKCAVLPGKAKHKCDDHTLFLHYGEEPRGEYWCDICETTIIDPSKWFYSCDHCGTTLHINCVLGEFPFLAPATIFAHSHSKSYEAVQNNTISRPHCSVCNHRCRSSVILMTPDGSTYLCSLTCLESFEYT